MMIVQDYLVIPNVFSAEELVEIRAAVAATEMEDGKNTAKGMARNVKNNLQISSRHNPELLAMITKRVTENQAVRNWALPKQFTNLMVSKYGPGMEYGSHNDGAVMGPHRTDISFTVFLTEPDTYEGGELVIETGFGEQTIKLAAGQMVLYPTGVMHRVKPVITGDRIVAIGWIQSRIRQPACRQMLHELQLIQGHYMQKIGHDRGADLLGKVISNLQRMWDS